MKQKTWIALLLCLCLALLAGCMPKPEEKALSASVPPLVPSVQQPESTTARPVIVHTMMVSKNTSKEPQRPCSTG